MNLKALLAWLEGFAQINELPIDNQRLAYSTATEVQRTHIFPSNEYHYRV